jgi:hypothetical protein
MNEQLHNIRSAKTFIDEKASPISNNLGRIQRFPTFLQSDSENEDNNTGELSAKQPRTPLLKGGGLKFGKSQVFRKPNMGLNFDEKLMSP